MKEICTDLYYEDIEIGDTIITAKRTITEFAITEFDVMQFSGLTGDYSEIHTSLAHTLVSTFDERVVHELLLLSIANGLYACLSYFNKADLVLLALNNWRFICPVGIGDTVFLKIILTDKSHDSKPGCGIFEWQYELYYGNHELCAQGKVIRLIKCKDVARTKTLSD